MKQPLHFFFPPHLWFLLAGSLALNLLSLALPLMTMQIYNRVLTNHATDTLLVLSTGVIVAAIFELLLRISRSVLVGRNGAAFEHEASCAALERVLHTEPRSTNKMQTATLSQDISIASRLKEYYGGQMAASLLIDLPFALLFLGLVFYLSGWLGLVPVCVLVVFGYFSWRQVSRLHMLMAEREAQDNRRYNFIAQSLQSVHTLKALCLEALTTRRFEEVQRESGQVNYHIATVHGASATSSYTSGQMMTVAVVSIGAPLVIYGYLSIGALVACVLLSGQVMQPLQRSLALWVRMQDILVARERLATLLHLPARPRLALEQLNANHGDVRLENIRFSYREGTPVLDGVSMTIQPGETIAVLGAPGSGKTTFLELLAGVYAPDRGRVLLSGMDVSAIPPAERSRFIGYLPNKGMILRGSIMENLTGFDSRLRAQAHSVAGLLGIEPAVAMLPQGYDTPLEGLSSDLVPPGLKQRIAIGRALLHKPRLILYDNADQGLDRESYDTIFNLLARLKGKATLVIASDDRNILSLADHVVELRRGQAVAMMEPATMLTPRAHL